MLGEFEESSSCIFITCNFQYIFYISKKFTLNKSTNQERTFHYDKMHNFLKSHKIVYLHNSKSYLIKRKFAN